MCIIQQQRRFHKLPISAKASALRHLSATEESCISLSATLYGLAGRQRERCFMGTHAPVLGLHRAPSAAARSFTSIFERTRTAVIEEKLDEESRVMLAEIESLYGRSAPVQQLSPAIGALDQKEAEIRLRLRSRGGHRGKVDNKVLVWLEEFENIKNHLSDLTKPPGKFFFGLPFLKVNRNKEVVQLINEVKSLTEKASSFQVIHDSNDVDRVQGVQPSHPLIGKLAQEISDQIWNDLMGPGIGMIGLYGLGGVGKTTIMQNIKNQLTNTDIFDKIIWVTLSKNMDMESVQDDIAKQLNIKLPRASGKYVRGYSNIILQHLQTVKRCLVILDDVWDIVSLYQLGIPQPGRNNGCKIVLTTRFREFCDHWDVHRWMYLSPLSENEAWGLFVSRSGDHVLGPDINSLARELVNECGGPPLNVITVAHAMRDEVDPTAWM